MNTVDSVVFEALQAARSRLSVPDYRSAEISLKRTIRSHDLPATPTAEAPVRVPTLGRQARFAFRDPANAASRFVFDTLVEHRPTPEGECSWRLAGLFMTPFRLDENPERITATGPRVPNRTLWDSLANLGVKIVQDGDTATLDGPGLARPAQARGLPAAIATVKRKAQFNIARAMDPATNPHLASSRLLAFLAVEKSASEKATQFVSSEQPQATTGEEPASEGPAQAGPSEPRPEAESGSPDQNRAAPGDGLDADQRAAVAAILDGADLLIVGPPGTGKSAVITAASKALLGAGRTVAVTSSEPSALDVARRRLGADADRMTILSPLDIAALPLDASFDVLLIDEASRLSLDIAFALVWRAGQMVVIGDGAQLRCEGESLLDRVTARGLRRIGLRYHYRSKHRRLITISNIGSYEGALRTVPRPATPKDTGLKVLQFERPGTRATSTGLVNPSEAHAILERLRRHYDEQDPRSIAVVTANAAQADAIRKLAEADYADGRMKPGHFRDKAEPLIIRRCADIQGEERDIVLVSVVYAPSAGRKIAEFGSFDRPHSVERLNVMLSRSREEMVIHISFRASDILITESMPSGRIVMLFLRKMIDAIFHSDLRLAVPDDVARLAHRVGYTADNLGIAYGLKTKGSTDYERALVVTDASRPSEHWDGISAQLASVGWTVTRSTSAEVSRSDQDLLRRLVEKPRPAAS